MRLLHAVRRLDGKTLGSVDLKVAPYDNFHTMSEIYDELDALVDYAAGHTDLYVEQFSMGQSQGDNGPGKPGYALSDCGQGQGRGG